MQYNIDQKQQEKQELMYIIGINIYNIRENLRMSQMELWRLIWLSENDIDMLECGDFDVPNELLGRLWEIFDINPLMLLQKDTYHHIVDKQAKQNLKSDYFALHEMLQTA